MMEKIDSITIELRPRLCICNAFVRLKGNIQQNEIQVQLYDEYIRLILQGKTVNLLLDFIKVIPTTISALCVTSNWICFRIQTRSDPAFGSFKTEIVTNYTSSLNLYNNAPNKEDCFNLSKCTILCSCCKNTLSKAVKFKRFLPLPDIDSDPSEWFCCKHSQANTSRIIAFQESDFFYTPLVAVLHNSIFTDTIFLDKNILICKRCLHHIGKNYDSSCYKLWNCSIEYQFADLSAAQTASNCLNDFFIAVQTSMIGLLGEEIILHYNTHMENHYLRVKPMDRQLTLLTEPQNTCNSNSLCLQKLSVMTVLYKYETEVNNDTDLNLNLKYCEVSLQVIEAGFKYLVSSTKRYPETHRGALGHYIGYMELEKLKNTLNRSC